MNLKMFCLLVPFCFIFCFVFPGESVFGEAVKYPGFPSLISSLRVTNPDFCGEAVPLDIPEIRERFEKELLLSLWNRPQVILWIK